MNGQQQQVQAKPQNQFIMPAVSDAYQRNLIRDILNPAESIDSIENNYRGKQLNNEGEWIDVKGLTPVKIKGIFQLTGMLREHLPLNITLGNLTEDDIIMLIKGALYALCGIIHDKWEEFAFTDDDCDDPDLAICDRIYYAIRNNVYGNLTRAKNGRENQLLRTVYKSHEIGTIMEKTSEIQGQSGSGYFGNLFKRKQPQNQNQGGNY